MPVGMWVRTSLFAHSPHIAQHGCMSPHRESFQDGYVSVHTLDNQVLVQGMDRNRAVEGDVVAVELFKEDKWSKPSGALP